jgi:hypothetical protein
VDAVAQPDDGGPTTESFAIGPLRAGSPDQTVEFAPGLKRPPALGTPPPPPRPGDPMFEARLGPPATPPGRARKALLPVLSVGLSVALMGGGLAYLGGIQGSSPGPVAAAQLPAGPHDTVTAAGASPAAPSPTPTPAATHTTAANPPRTTSAPPSPVPPVDDHTDPPVPKPTLSGLDSVMVGIPFSVQATGFGCAGTPLAVTLGSHKIAGPSLDAAGNGQIVVSPDPAGRVPIVGGGVFTLGAGSWTLTATVPDQSGCSAASASLTVTVVAA